MIEDLRFLFDRDLTKLSEEVQRYKLEANLWKVEGEIINSGGTLCVHLCGNLKSFIGHHIGGLDYKRDREFEFSGLALDRENLLAEIEETKIWVDKSLAELSSDHLGEPFPIQPFPRKLTFQNFLLHLHGHLNYHLGQINYHRRLIDRP